MTWLWLTAGMAARTVQMSVQHFKRSDWYAIPIALLFGFLVVVEIADDYRAGDTVEPWMGMPLGFALVIAIMYKQRLLPTVTEGTLFGYGLVASYVLIQDFFTYGLSAHNFVFWILLLVPCYMALTIILVLVPQRIGKVGQSFLMTLFIAVNVHWVRDCSRNLNV